MAIQTTLGSNFYHLTSSEVLATPCKREIKSPRLLTSDGRKIVCTTAKVRSMSVIQASLGSNFYHLTSFKVLATPCKREVKSPRLPTSEGRKIVCTTVKFVLCLRLLDSEKVLGYRHMNNAM